MPEEKEVTVIRPDDIDRVIREAGAGGWRHTESLPKPDGSTIVKFELRDHGHGEITNSRP